MEHKPRCGRSRRFLPVQVLAEKLAKLGARIEGARAWELIVPFKSLEGLKEKRRRITTVLRRYEALVEDQPELLEVLKKVDSRNG